jgi:hypothetical protein
MFLRLVMVTCVVLLATASEDAVAGRTELQLREADIVRSVNDPLEVVLRLASLPAVGSRIDNARLELALDVDGDAATFVPFLVVTGLVDAVGPTGDYQPACPEAGRELILQPGVGKGVRMDVTGFMRRAYEAGGELYLHIEVVEPSGSTRPTGSIELSAVQGVLGKIVLITR